MKSLGGAGDDVVLAAVEWADDVFAPWSVRCEVADARCAFSLEGPKVCEDAGRVPGVVVMARDDELLGVGGVAAPCLLFGVESWLLTVALSTLLKPEEPA